MIGRVVVAIALLAAAFAFSAGILFPPTTEQSADDSATASCRSIQAATTLSDNTTRFPLVSFGLMIYDNEEMAFNLTRMALSAGFRNFVVDTGHRETFARACVESGIPREDLFVTAALPLMNDDGNEEEKDTPKLSIGRTVEDAYTLTVTRCRETLAAFSALRYVDQLLLDSYPGTSCGYIRRQWRALEESVDAKLVRTLAVTNFNAAKLDCLLDDSSLKIGPVVNQLPYNIAYHPANIIRENTDRGLLVQAWSPLGGGLSGKFTDGMRSICADIGRRHNKSFAQVALRWVVQKGAAFTTQSTVREHFLEDIDIFNFDLSEEEVKILDDLAG